MPPTPPPPTAGAGPKISGFINGSYNFNLNRPADNTNYTFSYHGQDRTFLLNAAHLVVAGTAAENLTYTIELDAGADARVNQYLNPVFALDNMGMPTGVVFGDEFDVQEAYLTWMPGKFGLRAGKFVTYNGIEIIEGPMNPTLSRGYLFGLAEPFTHVGANVIFQATPELDIHLGLINGWDNVVDTNDSPMFVGKVGYNMGNPLALTLSSYFGPDQPGNDKDRRLTVDLTGVTKTIPMVDLWFQVNYGTEKIMGKNVNWLGFGIQPVVHLTDMFDVGARFEFFKDKDRARLGGSVTPAMSTADQLINISICPTLKPTSNLIFRAEFRVDLANKESFPDKDGMAKKNQIVVLADATVLF